MKNEEKGNFPYRLLGVITGLTIFQIIDSCQIREKINSLESNVSSPISINQQQDYNLQYNQKLTLTPDEDLLSKYYAD